MIQIKYSTASKYFSYYSFYSSNTKTNVFKLIPSAQFTLFQAKLDLKNNFVSLLTVKRPFFEMDIYMVIDYFDDTSVNNYISCFNFQ